MPEKPEKQIEEMDEVEEGREDFFFNVYNSVRLIARLLGDQRVNIFLKLLPIGALVYLLVPTDLLPIVPVDDALVLYLGGYLFIELCPPDVVQEHRDNLRAPRQETPADSAVDPEVLDGEFRVVSPKDEHQD